ncbi:MAG: HAMP domain-containing histidine kinase [Clostridia bacterium]|nr:HAMP domain-containing histidine kinase [Clostridia bacterium]
MNLSDKSAAASAARPTWGYHISIKIMLVVLACAMLLTAVCGLLLLLAGSEFGLLTMNRTDFRHSLYDTIAWRQADSAYGCYGALHELESLDAASLAAFAQRMEANAPADLYLQVRLFTHEKELLLFDNTPADVVPDWTVSRTFGIYYYGEQIDWGYGSMIDLPTPEPEYVRSYEMTLTVPEKKTAGSLYATVYTLTETLHRLRWVLLLVTVVAVMLVIGIFALLILISGKQLDGSVRCNTVDHLPYDLFLALYFVFGASQGMVITELSYSGFAGGIIALCAGFAILDMPLLVLLFTSTATRCKCGTILKNTLLWRLMRLLWWLLRQFWRVVICGGVRGFAHLLRIIPLIWQGTALIALLSLSSLLITLIFADDLFALWLIANLILVPLGFYGLISLCRLRQGAQHLAQGDLGYRVDETALIGAFRRHGEDLNSIRQGINHAVEERMQSERFRTELITNVSHDIKTPLTSIINYIDLLDKELSHSERSASVEQYLDVIERQSLRLKKLIEDLTEASKASTGALSVNLAPCQVSVLLSQALAEYADKLEAAALEVVVRLPEAEPTIMLDGRLIWRVFDNLLSNAAKYSLRGTRLYIDVDVVAKGETDAQLRVVFRNISGQRLGISPSELMERFVRGDASRHTEGSGLGLSIAHSLIELHQGELKLDIDGDLFKATVLLPLGDLPT